VAPLAGIEPADALSSLGCATNHGEPRATDGDQPIRWMTAPRNKGKGASRNWPPSP